MIQTVFKKIHLEEFLHTAYWSWITETEH